MRNVNYILVGKVKEKYCLVNMPVVNIRDRSFEKLATPRDGKDAAYGGPVIRKRTR